jgi:hypothetical protein
MRHRKILDPTFAWAADNVLHTLAFLALHAGSPKWARSWTRGVASFWPVIDSVEGAQAMTRRLGMRGTCLSRSLAVAARCPKSNVVIGVVRAGAANTSGVPSIHAHAWVEIDSVPLESMQVNWVEVGRLD